MSPPVEVHSLAPGDPHPIRDGYRLAGSFAIGPDLAVAVLVRKDLEHALTKPGEAGPEGHRAAYVWRGHTVWVQDDPEPERRPRK
ncbi:MAG: hypothetical protein K8I02_07970 [Candidatus Methylomirabilis sp.]|nr:hypothetical protein [Deltaproteobacteria bacterium]